MQKYILIKKDLLPKLMEQPKQMGWYIILKDYAKRFNKDKHGYTRVPTKAFMDDYGVDRVKAWRYNKSLEDKGFIKVDRAHRGGRTWVGFRFI